VLIHNVNKEKAGKHYYMYSALSKCDFSVHFIVLKMIFFINLI